MSCGTVELFGDNGHGKTSGLRRSTCWRQPDLSRPRSCRRRSGLVSSSQLCVGWCANRRKSYASSRSRSKEKQNRWRSTIKRKRFTGISGNCTPSFSIPTSSRSFVDSPTHGGAFSMPGSHRSIRLSYRPLPTTAASSAKKTRCSRPPEMVSFR